MKTLEELRRRIVSVEDMQSVVSTMKTLAAVRIRQFETAAEATRAYSQTVMLALQVLIRDQPTTSTSGFVHRDTERVGCVLLGTDQGFCGRFNEIVSQAGMEFSRCERKAGRHAPVFLTVGSRLHQLVSAAQQQVSWTTNLPSTVAEITPVIQQIMPQIERWQRELNVQRIELFCNRRSSESTYEVNRIQLMPLADEFLQRIRKQPWQSRSLPVYHLPWRDLFTYVIRQYLFLQLFRAFAESLASENASRIAAMQQAEKNIEQRLSQLNQQFNQNRQQAITEELLEIMSGFEAASDSRR